MMQLHFTEDEMTDFLLSRGYVVCVRGEVYEVNTYQNRFVEDFRVIVEAIKDDMVQPIERAFEKEFKQQLLNI